MPRTPTGTIRGPQDQVDQAWVVIIVIIDNIRGDALLRKARRVLRQHRSPYDGTVRRSVLHIDATACGTLARWIRHSTEAIPGII